MDRYQHVSFVGPGLVTAPPAPAWRPRRAPRPPVPPVPPVAPAGRAPDPPMAAEDGPFLAWVLERAGLDPAAYRAEPLHRRLRACLRALRVDSAREARALLEREPALLGAALGAVVIGVTEFFRDAPVWEYLRHTLLPELLARRVGLRAWSVACSDGAELYSLAMLLAERDRLQPSDLLGLDCRADAIVRARAGCFDPAALADLPAAWRERYFAPVRPGRGAGGGCGEDSGGAAGGSEGRRVRACASLRQHLHWAVGDMFHPHEARAWDLIFCRNVAIYLQPHATAALWQRLVARLAPGGVLVVGKAEAPADRPSQLTRLAPCVFRKAG